MRYAYLKTANPKSLPRLFVTHPNAYVKYTYTKGNPQTPLPLSSKGAILTRPRPLFSSSPPTIPHSRPTVIHISPPPLFLKGHMSGLISPVSVLRRCGLCGMRRDPYTRIVGRDRVARDGVGLINARRSTAAAGSMKASAGEGVGGGAVGTRAGAGPVSKRKTWTYSVNQHAWNYFDMESLPRGMDMYR